LSNAALGEHQRAALAPLVDDLFDAGAPDHRAGDRQRPVKGESLLTVQDLAPVDAGLLVAHPEARPAQHDRHRRQRLEAFLEHELQFVRIGRIAAAAEPERVEHGVARAVAVLDVGKRPGFQGGVVDRHEVRCQMTDVRGQIVHHHFASVI
jgi:hypothetical protein